MLFSIATGWILQATHSCTLLFSIVGSAYLVSLLILFIIDPGLTPVEDVAL